MVESFVKLGAQTLGGAGTAGAVLAVGGVLADSDSEDAETSDTVESERFCGEVVWVVSEVDVTPAGVWSAA